MRARRIALAVVFGLLALQGGVSLAWRTAFDAFDQAHPALHLASGLLGLAFSLRERPQRLFGALFGAAYLALALAGAIGRVDVAWLPLEARDHAFHALLGSLVAALSLWKGKRAGRGRKAGSRPVRRAKR